MKNITRLLKSNKGMSLLELVFGLSILSIVLLSAMSFLSSGIRLWAVEDKQNSFLSTEYSLFTQMDYYLHYAKAASVNANELTITDYGGTQYKFYVSGGKAIRQNIATAETKVIGGDNNDVFINSVTYTVSGAKITATFLVTPKMSSQKTVSFTFGALNMK